MANERTVRVDPNATGAEAGADRPLGMMAQSVIIDNTTGQWWTIGGTDRRIPPYTTGIVVRLPNGTQVAQVRASTPPSFISVPRAGETAIFVFSDSIQREDSGRAVTPVPLASGTVGVDPTNGAGTITTPATAQNLFVANVTRTYLLIQNRSVDVLAVEIDGTAAVQLTSIALNPGAAGEAGGDIVFEGSYCPQTLISIIGPNAGAQFVAYEA